MLEEYPDLLEIKDVQKALNIGRTMTYRLINNGSIKHMRIGKSIKVPKQYLIDFISNSCYNIPIVMGNLSCHRKVGIQ